MEEAFNEGRLPELVVNLVERGDNPESINAKVRAIVDKGNREKNWDRMNKFYEKVFLLANTEKTALWKRFINDNFISARFLNVFSGALAEGSTDTIRKLTPLSLLSHIHMSSIIVQALYLSRRMNIDKGKARDSILDYIYKVRKFSSISSNNISYIIRALYQESDDINPEVVLYLIELSKDPITLQDIDTFIHYANKLPQTKAVLKQVRSGMLKEKIL